MRPVVTISASYGAGGAFIGPAVAERLGVPFLDRAIPTAVANELGIPLEDALSRDEQVQGWLARMLTAAAPATTDWMVGAVPPPGALLPDAHLHACTERAIREGIRDRGGVILGRAAAIVLHDHPTALHVRLDGAPERRIRQAMDMLGVSEQEAREALRRNDEARTAYVRHYYRTDPASAEHYHLVLDSTLIGHDDCVELILAAADARRRAAEQGRSNGRAEHQPH
ncbi:cytidylate kinase-like family protein [Pseudonocardia zijingensis]|jgi:cytidylate kinase|uniref:Cytidylate kinase n=1 Tax=Pseudonocardia zijingensis TaxID=153376 RepID=A0ABN1NDG4_9PSEU